MRREPSYVNGYKSLFPTVTSDSDRVYVRTVCQCSENNKAKRTYKHVCFCHLGLLHLLYFYFESIFLSTSSTCLCFTWPLIKSHCLHLLLIVSHSQPIYSPHFPQLVAGSCNKACFAFVVLTSLWLSPVDFGTLPLWASFMDFDHLDYGAFYIQLFGF